MKSRQDDSNVLVGIPGVTTQPTASPNGPATELPTTATVTEIVSTAPLSITVSSPLDNIGASIAGISYAPAIAAVPLPTPQQSSNVATDITNGDFSNQQIHQSETGLSSEEKRAIIVSASVGGTLILSLLLLYLLLRLRRGAPYSQITHFRAPSCSTIRSHFSDKHGITALPIYHTHRFSVRSCRHNSATTPAGKPAQWSLTAQSGRLGLFSWQPIDPSKVNSRGPRSTTSTDALRSSTIIQRPEQAHRSAEKVNAMTSTSDLSQGWSFEEPGTPTARRVNDVSAAQTPSRCSRTSVNPDTWSWTNSQAPTTPRIAAPNARASLSSFRKRNAASWVRNHSSSEPQTEDKADGVTPLLESHPPMPVLGPPPLSRRASRKNRRAGGDFSLLLRHAGDGDRFSLARLIKDASVSPTYECDDN